MRVQVTQKGFIHGRLVNIGEVIEVTKEEASPEWMALLDKTGAVIPWPDAKSAPKPAAPTVQTVTVEPKVVSQGEQLAAASQGVLTDPNGGQQAAPAQPEAKTE